MGENNQSPKKNKLKKDEDLRVPEEPLLTEMLSGPIEDEEELPPLDIRNSNSWFINFSPAELAVITTILAIILSNGLTLAEKAVLGSIFTALADNILLIAAQETLIRAAEEEQAAIKEREKEIKRRIADRLQAQKEKIEQAQKDQELKDMKERLKNIEELLNKQLRL